MAALSMVEAFVDFGMSEFDAWRCVHLMQGRSALVLLQVHGAHAQPHPADPLRLHAEQVEMALQSGAAWSRLADGGWQYLRRVNWRLEDLAGLREELARLSDVPAGGV